MAYAKEHGKWPRPTQQPAGNGKASTGTSTQTGIPSSLFRHVGGPRGDGGVGSEGSATTSKTDGPPSFTAEGLLKEALIRLWEQARAKKVDHVGALSIWFFDAADAFRMISVVAGIREPTQPSSLAASGGSTNGVAFQSTLQTCSLDTSEGGHQRCFDCRSDCTTVCRTSSVE
jgi:hypothetical protein